MGSATAVERELLDLAMTTPCRLSSFAFCVGFSPGLRDYFFVQVFFPAFLMPGVFWQLPRLVLAPALVPGSPVDTAAFLK